MRIVEIISEAPNRWSTTSTNDAGVTTTKFVGGGKSVSDDSGTTTYDASGRKTNYKSPTVNGFSQELKFKGGPRIDNVKNTYTADMGDGSVTKTTDGAGNMTNVGIKYGDAGVNVDNKGNANMSLQLTDRDRIRVSTQATPKSNMNQLAKLKSLGQK